MRRREFITLLGSGAVGALPLAARAQQAASPRRIGVKLGDRFDPFQCVAFAIQVEAGYLVRHPSSDGARAGVRNDETQLAQTPCAPALPHHLHPFGWCRHRILHP